MTAPAPTISAAPRPLAAQSASLGRVAATSALVAATTLTVTMAFLAIAHVAGGMRFGDGTHSPIVDGLHVVTALALLPIPFALHRLLTVDAGSFPMDFGKCDTALDNQNRPEAESAKLVLEAHENLVKADEANRSKFQDVLAFLHFDATGDEQTSREAYDEDQPAFVFRSVGDYFE